MLCPRSYYQVEEVVPYYEDSAKHLSQYLLAPAIMLIMPGVRGGASGPMAELTVLNMNAAVSGLSKSDFLMPAA